MSTVGNVRYACGEQRSTKVLVLIECRFNPRYQGARCVEGGRWGDLLRLRALLEERKGLEVWREKTPAVKELKVVITVDCE